MCSWPHNLSFLAKFNPCSTVLQILLEKERKARACLSCRLPAVSFVVTQQWRPFLFHSPKLYKPLQSLIVHIRLEIIVSLGFFFFLSKWKRKAKQGWLQYTSKKGGKAAKQQTQAGNRQNHFSIVKSTSSHRARACLQLTFYWKNLCKIQSIISHSFQWPWKVYIFLCSCLSQNVEKIYWKSTSF